MDSNAKLRLTLQGDNEARILESDGDRVTLVSTCAFPPGSTLLGTSALGETFRVKVRQCRQQPDGFSVTGRFVSLTRAARRFVLDALSDDSTDLDRAPDPN